MPKFYEKQAFDVQLHHQIDNWKSEYNNKYWINATQIQWEDKTIGVFRKHAIFSDERI